MKHLNWRDLSIDDGVMKDMVEEIGHPPPFSDEEVASLTRLHFFRARDISVLSVLSLRALHMVYCDLESFQPILHMCHLINFTVHCSWVHDPNLSSFASARSLVGFECPNTPIQDISILLTFPKLKSFDLTGTPLNEKSYREVLPQLCAGVHLAEPRRIFARYSTEEHWELTCMLHERGIRASVDCNDGCEPMLVLQGIEVMSLPGAERTLRNIPVRVIRDFLKRPSLSLEDFIEWTRFHQS